MAKNSSIARVIEILERLNSGKRVCVSSLAIEFDVSSRTIRRDFEIIRETFGNFLTKRDECYRAYERFLLDNVLRGVELSTLANIITLFEKIKRDDLISEKTKELIKHSKEIYDFKSRPFEQIDNYEILKKLEHSIKFQKEITIKYQTERIITTTKFQPYKIIFLNENFYMVGVNISNQSVEYRRVSMIKDIKICSKTFFVDRDIERFFEKLQTPWANYKLDEVVVKIRVDRSIRRYFKKKQYLSSQKITHTFENGDIEVEYVVTNFREIEDLLIKWLPKIRIIAPRKFKRLLKRTLEKKLHALYESP